MADLRADFPAFLAFGAALLAAVALGEALRAWGGWQPESSRRAVHATVGVLVALCPPLFASPAWIYVLAVGFIGVNLVAVPRRLLPGMHGIARVSWGTVTFPLALALALFLCWTLDAQRVFALQTAFVVLALSDPLASLVGTRLARPGRYVLAGNEKSWAGSAAFFGSAFVLVAAALVVLAPPRWGPMQFAAGALAAAALGTAAEALGGKGWDNLAIVAAVLVPLVLLHAEPEAAGVMLVAVCVASAFAVAAWRVGFLDASGAVAAALLAWGVVSVGGRDGAAWAAPGLAFFVLSSVLSRLGRRRKRAAEALAEKGSRRDAGQVVANGGVAGALLAGYVYWPPGVPGSTALYWGFVGAFAAAAADTWATEIGTLVGGPTRSVRTGRRVAPGTSGGVSAAGTLGAMAGAASVAASVLLAGQVLVAGVVPFRALAVLIGAGLMGALFDSLLGATVQARYRDPATSGLTERAVDADGHALALAAGVRGVTNDRVNLACTVVGALVALLSFVLFTEG